MFLLSVAAFPQEANTHLNQLKPRAVQESNVAIETERERVLKQLQGRITQTLLEIEQRKAAKTPNAHVLGQLEEQQRVLSKEYQRQLRSVRTDAKDNLELTFVESDLERQEKVAEMLKARIAQMKKVINLLEEQQHTHDQKTKMLLRSVRSLAKGSLELRFAESDLERQEQVAELLKTRITQMKKVVSVLEKQIQTHDQKTKTLRDRVRELTKKDQPGN